jgi:hypothetical protein
MLIAGTETMAAPGAIIVGAFESKETEYAVHPLAPTSDQARFLPTSTTRSRASFIGRVGIEALLDGRSGQSQNLLPHGEFQRFQIQVFHCLTTEERLNLLNDVGGQ